MNKTKNTKSKILPCNKNEEEKIRTVINKAYKRRPTTTRETNLADTNE